ncbi:MAG: SMP-30/gluconolactonase/LRE family protein [Verrucomicrobiota bacterium]|jgi:enterochelin esterase-like enzyme|nr:SMP-30/gluconolactonase/LRE family protein [Verrucomicrobiota bacterium]
MFFRFLFAAALAGSACGASAQMPAGWEEPLPSGPMNDAYELTPDSQRQPGVPQGKVFSFKLEDSKIFPGTRRNIQLYVPSQYTADQPARVYVGLDGLGMNAAVVFDNLIHKGELPVIIGVGLPPGAVPPAADDNEDPRFNRSYEFDGVNDLLCRFLLEEVFPLAEQQKTPDGLPVRLSRNPDDRCAGGGSTGGIGAFKLAWERPDQFRRVFSAIGTFVSMRGGDRYPALVRKTEPQPLRVFLQDGHHDQWLGGPEVGDWWMGNVTLNRALEFSGYDVRHAWGTGPHSGKQAAALFPDAMRWLWRDGGAPVTAAPEKSLNVFLKQILLPGEGWTRVDRAPDGAATLAVDAKGAVTARAFAPGEAAQSFALPNGDRYAADPAAGTLALVKADGARRTVAERLVAPGGVAVTPDGRWLAAVESRTHWGTSFRVEADGSLTCGQRFYWFHVPDADEDLGSGQCTFDADGRLYVATRLGVSVLDRNGRTRAILPLPNTDGKPAADAVAFGGEAFDTLYALSGGALFKRKLRVSGVPPAAPFKKLPPWGAG